MRRVSASIAALLTAPGMELFAAAQAKCSNGDNVFAGVRYVPYAEQHLWATGFEGAQTCGGKQQSPINLYTAYNTHTVLSRPLEQSFGRGEDMRLVNTGNSVEVQGTNLGTITIFASTSMCLPSTL